jgi:hypothetical protein
VEYIKDYDYGTIAVQEQYVKVHRVVLTGLMSNTMYHLIVRAIDTSGNGPTTTDDLTFFTTNVPDRTKPVITNVRADSITSNSAVISWATDEPSDSGVEYFSEDIGESVYDLDMVETHSIPLKNLEPNTVYTYRVISYDASGNGPSCSMDFSFKTSDNADIDAPMITDLRVGGITNTLAIVMWETDEPASGLVEYGNQSGKYDYHVEEEGYLKSHSTVLWGLEAGTTYFLRVQGSDADGNGPSVSEEVKFMTTSYPDNFAPQITNLKVTEVSHDSVTIEWQTDEPSDSWVHFGKGGTYDMIAKDPRFLFDHSLTISDLEANTTYRFSVRSIDPSDNDAQSEEKTFTTLDVYVPPPPPPPDPPPGPGPGTNVQGAMPWIALFIVIALVVVLGSVMYSKGIIGGTARRKKKHHHKPKSHAAPHPHRTAAATGPHAMAGLVSDEGLCPHCHQHISLTTAAQKAQEERRKEEERKRREAEAARRKQEAAERHRKRLAAIDKRLETVHRPEDDHHFEEIPEDDELEDLYDEVEEEADAMEAEVVDGKPDWEPPTSQVLEDIRTKAEPDTAVVATTKAPKKGKRKPLKTVTCGNCGSKVPVFTEKRPVKISCPSCNKSGVLKKK